MKWIPVSERLPEEGTFVDCYVGGYMQGRYTDILFKDSGFHKTVTIPLHNVTHWMPLPEPPEEV